MTLDKQYRYKTTLAANKQYCGKLATVTHAELVALNAIQYPTDTVGDAKVVIRYDASDEADLRSCAVSRTVADWNHFWALNSTANQRAHAHHRPYGRGRNRGGQGHDRFGA